MAGQGKTAEFTIITVTSNAAATVGNCLHSLRNAGAAAEQIVVDNLSADDTLAEVKKAAPAARIIAEADSGIYDAMNKGLRTASAPFIACLNSDDSYLDGTLAAVSQAFAAAPDAGIIHGNILVNGREYRPPAGIFSFGGARIFHPAAFIRREVFARLGLFDTRYRICADFDFFLRARRAGVKFVHLDRPLANFALGGISTVCRRETAREMRRILLAHRCGRLLAEGYYVMARLRALLAWGWKK